MRILKSKTLWFSWALMALGIIELNMRLLESLLGEWYGVAFIVVSIITATLRMVTTNAVADK
jgi:hypothetical protein